MHLICGKKGIGLYLEAFICNRRMRILRNSNSRHHFGNVKSCCHCPPIISLPCKTVNIHTMSSKTCQHTPLLGLYVYFGCLFYFSRPDVSDRVVSKALPSMFYGMLSLIFELQIIHKARYSEYFKKEEFPSQKSKLNALSFLLTLFFNVTRSYL